MRDSDQPPPPELDAISPSLQLAWGLRDAGWRGPRRGLTRTGPSRDR